MLWYTDDKWPAWEFVDEETKKRKVFDMGLIAGAGAVVVIAVIVVVAAVTAVIAGVKDSLKDEQE